MFRKKIKRVLVIGHRGFIGSHVMEAPEFADTDSDHVQFNVQGMDIKDGPLSDVQSDTWTEGEYDFIIFLACDFRESMEGYVENARMIAQVGRYMEAHQHTHLIYTSSAAVYPMDYASMKEENVHPQGAPSHYGQGKLLGEMGLRASSKRVTIFRLANVFGPRGRGVVDLIKSGERTIYGTGMQVRDFIHVGDVVRAIVAAVLAPKRWRGTFNVSTGHGHTVLSIYKEFGKKSPIFKKALPGDRKFSVLDNTKFMENIR